MDTFAWSDAFADNMDGRSGLQQQRRAGMSQAVELDRLHCSRFDQRRVLPLAQVVDLQRPAETVCAPL
jgi:hypothetical protein